MIGLHRFDNEWQRISGDNVLIRGPALLRRGIAMRNLCRQLDLEIRESFEMQHFAKTCNCSRADPALLRQLCDPHMNYFSGGRQNALRQLALHLGEVCLLMLQCMQNRRHFSTFFSS
ncbi:hypothetical protein D3C86_1604420 [compost metagenome]